MKTITKTVLAASTVVLLTAVAFSPVLAMWGNGQWGWQWGGLGKVVTSEEKTKLQALSGDEKTEYMNELKVKYNISWEKNKGQGKKQGKKWSNSKKWHSPTDMLEKVEKQEVSAEEIDLLKKQYEEELMANELYMSFYEKYGIETFKNIANSESKHMEAVQALLDRYDIATPTNYDHIQDLYDSLKESGSKSAFDALEVWVKIEFVDIDDIIKAIKATNNDDIKIVLTNIGGASYNHLRGFLKAIDNNGYSTDLDWKAYIDESDKSVKGPIKYKLAEKLESEGVNLPEQVSSESMKNKKCDDDHWKKGENKKQEEKKVEKSSPKFMSYKTIIQTKYGAKISALPNTTLNVLIWKIDALSAKVQNSSAYSDVTKEKYKLILGALKEIVLENLDENELDIENLFY